MTNRLSHWILVACLACTVTVVSQEETATKDYSKGLAAFFKLGLTDTTGGKLVAFNTEDYREHLLDRDVDGWQLGNSLTSAGWLMDETDGVATVVTMSGLTWTFVSPDAAKRLKANDEAALEALMAEGATTATWAAMEFETLMTSLNQEFEQAKQMQEMEMTIDVAPVFLFAAHLYRQGEKDQANSMIATCESLAGGDIRVVLVQAINYMADQRQAWARNRLESHGDWMVFADELEAIAKQYGKGWKLHADALALAAELRASAAQAEPAMLGEEHGPKAQALAAELASGDGADLALFGGNFLLGTFDPEEEPDAKVLALLHELGMEAIPVLLALLDDKTLVMANTQMFEQAYGLSDVMSDDDAPKLARPGNRGVVAKIVLIQAMPRSDELWALDQDALRERAQTFYDENKDIGKQELVKVFIAAGGDTAVTAAATLITADAAANAELLESMMLTKPEDDPTAYDQLALAYVKARGAEAKTFADAYLEARGKWIAGSMMAEWLMQQQEQLKVQFELLTEDLDAAELVQRAVKDDEGFSTIAEMLAQRMASEEDGKHVMACLERLAASENDQVRVRCIQLILYSQQMRQATFESPADILQLAHTRETWQKALDDESELNLGQPFTVAQLIGYVIEQAHTDELEGINSPDEELRLLIVRRAKAHLAGEEPPKLPSANDLDEAGRAALRTKLVEADGAARIELMNNLAAGERMALQEMLADDEELAKSLAIMASVIRAIQVENALVEALGEEKIEAIRAKKNTPLDLALIGELQALAKEQAAAGGSLVVLVQVGTPSTQTTLSLSAAPQGALQDMDLAWICLTTAADQSTDETAMKLELPEGEELSGGTQLSGIQMMIENQEMDVDSMLAARFGEEAEPLQNFVMQIFATGFANEDADEDAEDAEDADADAEDDAAEAE